MNMHFGLLSSRFALVLLAGAAYSSPVASAGPGTDAPLARATALRGHFAREAGLCREMGAAHRAGADTAARIDALLLAGESYRALGRNRESLEVLNRARTLARGGAPEPSRWAAILGSLGEAYARIADWDAAEVHLREAVSVAAAAGDSALLATTLNGLGNLHGARGAPVQALAAFRESAAVAATAGAESLLVKALTNGAHAALDAADVQEAARLLEAALKRAESLATSLDQAEVLLAGGRVAQALHDRTQDAHWLALAQRALEEAADRAAAADNHPTRSYALGYLGRVYEKQGHHREALALTRGAAFAAQQAGAPEIRFLWQWQTGRLLRAAGDVDGAIAAYRRAVYDLERVRPNLSRRYDPGPISFHEPVEPVFLELADLLLARAAALPDREAAEDWLIQARAAVEQHKAAELQDYFRDDCVAAFQARTAPLDRAAPRTAVVYPILLEGRTELLLSLPDGMRQVTVPVAQETLTREVRAFRRTLEKRTTREYLPHARRLDNWLILPLREHLDAQGIDTLVFVPGGPLRTVPMAALHDGDRFLVERYVLATTPGLTLTDPRPLRRRDLQVLAGGLAQPVQGFPPLRHVREELEAIQTLYQNTTLRDAAFRIPNLRAALAETAYPIVHVASHGRFSGDVEETFILTYNERMTMDHLERIVGLGRFRDQPVELLVLSACQTAAGDDRAALGLAGVAIKAGARSALATLWHIDDAASAQLVAEFYRQLLDPGNSKARALRRAQLALLGDRRYRHPGYWSPFLLMGNWL